MAKLNKSNKMNKRMNSVEAYACRCIMSVCSCNHDLCYCSESYLTNSIYDSAAGITYNSQYSQINYSSANMYSEP